MSDSGRTLQIATRFTTNYMATDMRNPNFRSMAFRKGFLEGIAAYYDYFEIQTYPRAKSIDTSVGGAWRAVGDALRQAELSERGKIGKITRKTAEESVAA